MNTIELFKCVELLIDKPPRLKAGAKGIVVEIHQVGVGYEVEFFDEEGWTIAVETCMAMEIKPLNNQ